MLLTRIQLDDGTVVRASGMMFFETYEGSQKPRRWVADRNALVAKGFELSIKRMFPQYPLISLIDKAYFERRDLLLPDVSCSLILHAERELRALLVMYYQDDLKDIVSAENLKRVKAIDWPRLSKEYLP